MKKKLTLVLLVVLLLNCIPAQSIYAKSISKETKTAITKLIKKTTTYAGIELTQKIKPGKTKEIVMTDRNILDIVGIDYANPTKSKIEKKVAEMFGLDIDIKSAKLYKSEEAFNASGKYIGRLKDGTVLTLLGDWGMEAPMIKLKSIKTTSNYGEYIVKTKCVLVDANGKTTRTLGTITYDIKACDYNKSGFVINQIKLTAAK